MHGTAPYVEGIEVDWKRKDGHPLRVRLSGTAVRDGTGAVEGFEMIVEDVTERHTLEAERRHRARLQQPGDRDPRERRSHRQVVASRSRRAAGRRRGPPGRGPARC